MIDVCELFNVEVDDETAKELEFLRTKKISIEAIFKSYMADFDDRYNKDNLNDFLDCYTLSYLKFHHKLNAIVLDAIDRNEDLKRYQTVQDYFNFTFSYREKRISVLACSGLLNRGDLDANKD